MSNVSRVESSFGELIPLNSPLTDPVTLVGRIAVVGRATTFCDAAIDHPDIKKQHCRFTKSGRSVLLEDLSNSTRLNGKAITGAPELTTGDLLTLGALEFEFKSHIRSLSPQSQSVNVELPEIARSDSSADEQWYAEAVGQSFGPMNRENLVQMVRTGVLSPDDTIHSGDPSTAKPCRHFPFLAKQFQQSDQNVTSSLTDVKSESPSDSSKEILAPKKKRKRKRPRKQSVEQMLDDVLITENDAITAPPASRLPQAEPDEQAAPVAPVPSPPTVTGRHSPQTFDSKKQKPARSRDGLKIDPAILKMSAIVVGGLLLAFGAYSIFFSAPIDREAVVKQLWTYNERLKYARSSDDAEQLKRLGEDVQSETNEVVEILSAHSDSDHKTDKAILFLIKTALPEAIAAPTTDEEKMAVVEQQIKIAQDAL